MSSLHIEHREASSGRVPSPEAGQVLVFTRYHEESAVVLHPDDFRRLAALEEALDAPQRITPSDIALAAHLAEDAPGAAIEDADQIAELLSL